jgi:hypothetical protein
MQQERTYRSFDISYSLGYLGRREILCTTGELNAAAESNHRSSRCKYSRLTLLGMQGGTLTPIRAPDSNPNCADRTWYG